MLILWLLRLAAFLALVGGLAYAGFSVYKRYPTNSSGYRDTDAEPKRTLISSVVPGLVVAAVAFLFFGLFISAKYVPGNHVAVVENTTNGSYSTIGPGIHFWPVEGDLVPFASKVTTYNLKQTRIEIGKPNEENGRPTVAAASGSPGEPPVYFWLVGWAQPSSDPDAIVELHRRYGPDWADSWVEANWQETTKAIQGQHELTYVGGNRDQFSIEVQEALQPQLTVNDEVLVRVDQIAVRDYDYNDATNARLERLADSENERVLATQAQEIAAANAEREAIEAETRLTVATKDAETEIARARGEAEAIRITNEAIAQQGSGYLLLKWIEKWDGKLPITSLGDANDFMLNLGNSLAGTAGPQG